jgi:hypothetical protein
MCEAGFLLNETSKFSSLWKGGRRDDLPPKANKQFERVVHLCIYVFTYIRTCMSNGASVY